MSKLLQAVEMTLEIVAELRQHQNQPPPDKTPIRDEPNVLLPSLGERAFHGLAGEFVKVLFPHTEADTAALLVQTLVVFGAAVGRGPHLILDGSRHQPNEYAVIVGASGKERKGASWARIKSVLEGAVRNSPPIGSYLTAPILQEDFSVPAFPDSFATESPGPQKPMPSSAPKNLHKCFENVLFPDFPARPQDL